jgi:hypothetical protein
VFPGFSFTVAMPLFKFTSTDSTPATFFKATPATWAQVIQSMPKMDRSTCSSSAGTLVGCEKGGASKHSDTQNIRLSATMVPSRLICGVTGDWPKRGFGRLAIQKRYVIGRHLSRFFRLETGVRGDQTRFERTQGVFDARICSNGGEQQLQSFFKWQKKCPTSRTASV